MQFPPSIQARIAAASTTVQQLVYDVVIDHLMREKSVDTLAPIDGETLEAEELGQVLAFIKTHIKDATRGAWPYRPDSDAIAYGIAAAAGRTMQEIARFFGVEYTYARTKVRRLREHARKAA